MARKFKVRRTKSTPKSKGTATKKAAEQVELLDWFSVKEIPGLPRSDGPRTIEDNRGKDYWRGNMSIVQPGERILVELEPGAFWWAWESLEHQALEQYRRYDARPGGSMTPDRLEASKRALEEIRRAGNIAYPNPKLKKAGRFKVKRAPKQPERKFKVNRKQPEKGVVRHVVVRRKK